MNVDLSAFASDELLALARIDLEAKRMDAGLYKLKEIIKNDPDNETAIGELARLYAQIGLPNRAIPLYEKLTQTDPSRLTDRLELGMVNLDLDQTDQAISVWSALLNDAPGFPPARFYTAVAHARSEQFDKATQLLEELLKDIDLDNLYYSRAKELLKDISQRPQQKNNNNGDNNELSFMPPDGYKTQH